MHEGVVRVLGPTGPRRSLGTEPRRISSWWVVVVVSILFASHRLPGACPSDGAFALSSLSWWLVRTLSLFGVGYLEDVDKDNTKIILILQKKARGTARVQVMCDVTQVACGP